MAVGVVVVEEATEVEVGVVDMTEEVVEMTEGVVEVVMMGAVIDMHQSKPMFVSANMRWKGLAHACAIWVHMCLFVCSRRRSPDYESRGRRRSPSYDRGRSVLSPTSCRYAKNAVSGQHTAMLVAAHYIQSSAQLRYLLLSTACVCMQSKKSEPQPLKIGGAR